ncbi:hypothetical protein TNCV_4158341 [Trichonephila clavipes]|nr:hypothetical protein TNCV_4158341 [Trichonephila clavipes]
MGQYDDDECSLPMCVHHNTAKYGYNHLDAVNRTWIHLKKRYFTIRAPKFVVEHAIEDAPVCDVASRCDGLIATSTNCPPGFLWGQKGNSFQPTREEKREYSN